LCWKSRGTSKQPDWNAALSVPAAATPLPNALNRLCLPAPNLTVALRNPRWIPISLLINAGLRRNNSFNREISCGTMETKTEQEISGFMPLRRDRDFPKDRQRGSASKITRSRIWIIVNIDEEF